MFSCEGEQRDKSGQQVSRGQEYKWWLICQMSKYLKVINQTDIMLNKMYILTFKNFIF